MTIQARNRVSFYGKIYSYPINMEKSAQTLPILPAKHRTYLALPAIVLGIGFFSYILLIGLFPPSNELSPQIHLGVGIAGIGYTLLMLYLLPLLDRYQSLQWWAPLLNGVILAFYTIITPLPALATSAVLAAIIITISAIISGRWPSYLFALVHIICLQAFALPDAIMASTYLQNAVIIIFSTVIITETVVRLRSVIDLQVQRLETINRVSQRISSTLDNAEVIEIVKASIQEALDADTYFLGILSGKNTIRLELLCDDGVFFPAKDYPMGNGPGAWVVHHRRSLIFGEYEEALAKYNLEENTVGKNRFSNSWIGTPLIARGEVIGLVAVASYEINAFDEGDLQLLESVAKQAAMALGHAKQHGEVEEQSRRDSLTGAYNHRHYLELLDTHVQEASTNETALAVIMLDIDHFKRYNDTFGHQVGDQVLVELCQTINEYIKRTDVLGRWGGEEFSLILLDVTGEQALRIAERVRNKLNNTEFTSLEGKTIPAPTISQGVAMFPKEGQKGQDLIHLADQRLYRAKARGRNQIAPSLSHWQELFGSSTTTVDISEEASLLD